MKSETVIIIGAGPCGLSAAIELQKRGIDALIIEKGNLVHAIYQYPTHQQFFSTSEKLEIGQVPFYSTERKPKRNEALVYYRRAADEFNLRISPYEEVTSVEKTENGFTLTSVHKGRKKHYHCRYVIAATGYYGSPNFMHIPGEDQAHVHHYFHEAHPYFKQKVTIIGGKNSAVDAALELEKAGAEVTVLYRGSDYSTSIKPWILPEFESLVRHGKIKMIFEAEVCQIDSDSIVYQKDGVKSHLASDAVFAMTGYHPDHRFLRNMGVNVDDDTGRPFYDPDTMETNAADIYIAGVIAAGNNANEIFIENGRWHGQLIAKAVLEKEAQPSR
ncbi:YpdA family putative bacillithiol disulfide reductase [Bacillus daqingensis]|uniref:YpdA family putative bacillithiol disulfide reductase n=1 Tax=Bacillus daqingensis TaxID=872396 RepID=A0ABV9P119_9BACI